MGKMSRYHSLCDKESRKKGTWAPEEDEVLINYVQMHGEGKWRTVAQRTGLKRCGKSCRLRWLNYLRPGIKRGDISTDEEDLILRLHRLLGNRWALIAGRLPGRTDNEIKNYWKTVMAKKLLDQDPRTHFKSVDKNDVLDEASDHRRNKACDSQIKALATTKVEDESLNFLSDMDVGEKVLGLDDFVRDFLEGMDYQETIGGGCNDVVCSSTETQFSHDLDPTFHMELNRVASFLESEMDFESFTMKDDSSEKI